MLWKLKFPEFLGIDLNIHTWLEGELYQVTNRIKINFGCSRGSYVGILIILIWQSH